MAKLGGVLLIALSVCLVGCAKSESTDSGKKDADATHAMEANGTHSMENMGDHDKDASSEATLPAGANKVCPVTGDDVDPEIFVEYQGHKIYLCCDDCVAKVKADPATYYKKAYPDAK
jgi:major membrane immunogen (membrane-anchored lipoprotein)